MLQPPLLLPSLMPSSIERKSHVKKKVERVGGGANALGCWKEFAVFERRPIAPTPLFRCLERREAGVGRHGLLLHPVPRKQLHKIDSSNGTVQYTVAFSPVLCLDFDNIKFDKF